MATSTTIFKSPVEVQDSIITSSKPSELAHPIIAAQPPPPPCSEELCLSTDSPEVPIPLAPSRKRPAPTDNPPAPSAKRSTANGKPSSSCQSQILPASNVQLSTFPEPAPDKTNIQDLANPKHASDVPNSILIGQGGSPLAIYTRYLTAQLATLMWSHATNISHKLHSQLMSVPPGAAPNRPIQFLPSGGTVTDWFTQVSQACPHIYSLCPNLLLESTHIDQQNLKAAVETTPIHLPSFAENALVKFARHFKEPPPRAITFASHAIFEAVVFASAPCHNQGHPSLDKFYSKVLAIIDVFIALSNKSSRSELKIENVSYPTGPLVCFLLAGIRGLFFGPTHNRSCTPACGALLLDAVHDLPQNWPDAKAPWNRTEAVITRKLTSISEANSSVQPLTKSELARAMTQDFLTYWATRTSSDLPWIHPRGPRTPCPPVCNLMDVFRDSEQS